MLYKIGWKIVLLTTSPCFFISFIKTSLFISLRNSNSKRSIVTATFSVFTGIFLTDYVGIITNEMRTKRVVHLDYVRYKSRIHTERV